MFVVLCIGLIVLIDTGAEDEDELGTSKTALTTPTPSNYY